MIHVVALFPVSAMMILVLLIIRQWIPIRLMPLNVSRVGHLGIDVEYALSDLARGTNDGRRIRLIIIPKKIDLPVANRKLLRLWCANTPWITSIIGVPLLWAISNTGLGKSLLYTLPKNINARFNWGTDPYGVTARGGAHLRFSRMQIESAEAKLNAMGLDLTKPFACLHVRDGRYHSEHSGGLWTEPHTWRNIPVRSFEKAAKILAARGVQVVRVGVHVADSFIAADEKEIFDYATNGYRDELLDVFLISRCTFMISTSSGIDSLAQVFRKPLFNVGVIAPSQMYVHRRVFSIVQRFRLRSSGHLLSLTESLALPKISDASISNLGLEAVANTEDEIAELAIEASDRAFGTWHPSEEQLELQRRFVALLPSEFRRFEIRGGMGSHFLNSHRDWLN